MMQSRLRAFTSVLITEVAGQSPDSDHPSISLTPKLMHCDHASLQIQPRDAALLSLPGVMLQEGTKDSRRS